MTWNETGFKRLFIKSHFVSWMSKNLFIVLINMYEIPACPVVWDKLITQYTSESIPSRGQQPSPVLST